MTTYTVSEDYERLDRIARAIFGTERGGTVEALLTANPGLADLGPYLPRGTAITVPVLPDQTVDPTYVRPWE